MWQALTLQAGYNAAVVTLGAASLGLAAGAVGAFLFLRRRSLVPDAMAHATLPGLALAFLGLVALGLDGRWLPGLLAGAAASALAGLWLLGRLTARTRLAEDAAIGAVLSVGYGLGIVLLTVIQQVPTGQASGLEGFLLGSVAGMLQADAVLIGGGGAAALAALWLMRRPLLMVAFDRQHAQVLGLSPARMDAALMLLVLVVLLLGLRVVGAILVVALLVTPAATARLWTDRAEPMAAIAGGVGAAAGWVGAAASAALPGLPTGALIVLLAAGAFVVSALAAPRGVFGRMGRV